MHHRGLHSWHNGPNLFAQDALYWGGVVGVGEWVSGGWVGQNHRTEDAVMDIEPERLPEFSFSHLDLILSGSGPLISLRTSAP